MQQIKHDLDRVSGSLCQLNPNHLLQNHFFNPTLNVLLPGACAGKGTKECKESELMLRRTADNVVSAAQCWEGNLRTSCMVSKQLVSCTFPGIPAFHSEFILEKNQHRTPNSLGPGKVQKFTKGGRCASATERLEEKIPQMRISCSVPVVEKNTPPKRWR